MATPAQAAMNIWTEHRNPEGRTYWFNTGTRESVWEKPDDLKTPFERALNQTKWKEYFSGGRKYYYNTDTKESKWDMPDELLLVLENVERDGQTTSSQPTPVQARINAPGFTPVGGGAIQGALVPMGSAEPSSSTSASQPNGADGAVGIHTGALPFAPTSILPARPNLPDDPVIPHNGFATVEEGEKAFTHLLRKAGVDANWTWDQTMRAIITDPLYKALNTLAEKKAAWQKFTDALKAKEQEEREARLSKLRPALRNMLKGNPNVFHFTTFATADKLFAQHPIWQQAKIEAERKLIFEEYVTELKQREVQETRSARARSISKVVSLFKQLNVDVVTRWRTAHTMVLESEEWNEDPELRKLPTLDILLAFEDYSRIREREYEEQMRRSQVEKTRKERKARESFKELLRNLVNSGNIKARTKWKEIYPTFSMDDRYLTMLGNPGSNPLELFWDVVDALDQKLDAKIAIVQDAIKRYNAKLQEHSVGVQEGEEARAEVKEGGGGGRQVDRKAFEVGPETTNEEFMAVIRADTHDVVMSLSGEDLYNVFETVQRLALKNQADEKRRTERKQRHLQDDLRYALKKLPVPLDISLSYDAAVPLIQSLPEYKALEDDEGRRAAFAKFVKRQKERLREAASEDGASTTSRKRKDPVRDHREGDRDWDREQEREKDRGEKEREKEREPPRERERDRGKEYERESRSSRHYHRHDDYDGRGHRSSREYGKEREREKEVDREREKEKEKEKEKERDGYRSAKHAHYRDVEKEDRRKDREGGREREREKEREKERERKNPRSELGSGYTGRDWEEATASKHAERERSTSGYREESREKRDVYEDRIHDERAEKRVKYDREKIKGSMDVDSEVTPRVRAETPEEGEI